MNAFVISCAAFLAATASAAAGATLDFEGKAWEIVGESARVEDFAGREGTLRLDNTKAFLASVSFRDTVIEFDVHHPADRAFLGVVFRAADFGNFEEFYLRPHRSDVPDSFQYTPVFDGSYGWQLYAGPGFSGALPHAPGIWRHVKVIAKGDRAAVFVDDMSEPALYMHDLKRETASGFVGLRVLSYTSAAHFSNFTVRDGAGESLPPMPDIERTECAACINSWQISPALRAGTDVGALPEDGWTGVSTEPDGLLNIARHRSFAAGSADTVFARLVIRSEKAEHRPLDFGFSDAATVYVNGAPIFSGDDTYASRDYRYLGTIGFFDRVYLPLQPGDNEVLIAVHEAFGGWGLKAKFAE